MSSDFIFILFFSNVVVSQSVYRWLSLQTGASVTIPCPYDSKYIQHKKYWCYDAGGSYNYCTIQAYANDTQDKVTVTDNPAESLFTVTMIDLQTGNTGSYWCVVEIKGITHDVTEYLYITVKADPDLYVMNSSVSGEEGGSVTVQCLYSVAYQKTQKQWCRFRDRSCNSVWRTDTSQNSAVHISDDGRRSFSVQMSGLKKSDAGWYWCSARHLKVPVHISVLSVLTTALTTTTHHVTTHTSVLMHSSASQTTVTSSDETTKMVNWYLIAFLFLLGILVIISCLLKNKSKAGNQIRTIENHCNTAVDTSSALKYNEEDVTYSAVKCTYNNETESPNDVEGEIVYSSIVHQ